MPAARLATFADLAALPERPHTEIIHGVIVPKEMTSAEHSAAQTGVLGWLVRRFHRASGGRWPGGWWFRAEIHVEYQPHEVYCHDIAGWRRDRVERPAGWPVYERPDWVCEVLSPGHEKRDLVDKLWTLHAAGVPHYWVLDREDKVLTIYRWEPGGYLVLPPIASGQTVRAEPFDGAALRTAVIFDDEDDDE